MKIGFDAKRAVQNFTGLGNYSRFVIRNLAHLYPENDYILFSPSLPGNGESVVRYGNIKYIVKQGSRPFWRTYGMVEDIRRENLDLYHGLSNELPFGVVRSGAKSIVTIHDLIFLVHPHYYPLIDRRIYDLKARYACRMSDRIIAVSECTKRDIVRFYGVDPSRIDVVYQGCSPLFKCMADDAKKREVLEKYDLPASYLLSVGSIEERKNIMLAVRALEHLPGVHFVAIGGRRKYADEVEEYARRNGLSDRLHIRSDVAIEDLPAIMQQCDVFLYPSFYEGFGIPIIEALNSRVPVIAATGSCLEEAGGPGSLYVNPNDDKEFADAINRVIDNEHLRRGMVEKGIEYVKRFSDEKCTRTLMEVYEKTCAQGSKANH